LEALTRGEGGQARSGPEVSLEAPPGKATRRGRREDALGSASHERVESQGCPHCADREIVGWGRSHGLFRFRCKSCGRTFNALTKTPMAHLRKKERWLDHVRAMIEGKSLAKTAQL
jgi:transposase-like protein